MRHARVHLYGVVQWKQEAPCECKRLQKTESSPRPQDRVAVGSHEDQVAARVHVETRGVHVGQLWTCMMPDACTMARWRKAHSSDDLGSLRCAM